MMSISGQGEKDASHSIEAADCMDADSRFWAFGELKWANAGFVI